MNTIISSPDLTITETLCETLWQVALWPGVTRADLPATPGRIENGIARIGPQTWVVFEPNGALEVTLEEGTTLDIGHSRVRFSIEGPLARDVMMRLAPLDFRDGAFPDGAIKATSAHHISVWVARDGETWHIWTGFTFASVFRELLEETAGQWERV